MRFLWNTVNPLKLIEITDEAHKAAKKMAADREIPMNRFVSDLIMSREAVEKADKHYQAMHFVFKNIPE